MRSTTHGGPSADQPEPRDMPLHRACYSIKRAWFVALWVYTFGLVLAPRPALAQAMGDGGSSEGAEAARRGGLVCTPSTPEVQTRRPVPFDCRGDGETVRVSLRYREHRDAPWRTLELEPGDDSFRATLPCEMTMNSGRIEYFIVATDEAGDPLDTLGSKNTPLVLVLNPQSRVAPAYPGEEPPARCEERVLCPPDFPGCDDPDAAERGRPAAAKPIEQWFGVHFAADVGFVGGSDVCTSSNPDYDCFTAGSETPFPAPLPMGVAVRPGEPGDGYPGTDIATAPSLGTLRLLLSYDRAVSDRVSLGGRLGYAFGGGPTIDGGDFLPIHVEARLSIWPSGTWAASLSPYFHFGAGLAEVDLKQGDVEVQDCTEEAGRQNFLDCISAIGPYAPENAPNLPVRTLDAYRRLGAGFVMAGGGVLVPLGGRIALQANLNAMLLLPSVGFVFEPSLGFVYGL